MSRFDEEPDGDPHGECRAEIERLTAELAAAKATTESTGCPNCGDSTEHEWVLITPENLRYTGKTKLACMYAHTKATTPAGVIVARILDEAITNKEQPK